MEEGKIHKYASLCIIAVSLFAFAYFAIKHILVAVLPFLISFGAALLLRPLSHKIHSLTKFNERIVRLILAMLSSALFVSAVIGILWYIVNKSWQFLGSLSADGEMLSAITSFLNGGFFSKIAFGEEFYEYIKTALSGVLKALMEKLAEVVSGIARSLPSVFIFMIVTIISAAYFAYDLEGICGALKSVLPKRALSLLRRLRNAFGKVGGRYIRSYITIMSVTFVSLLVGFLIIGVEYATLIALFVAVLDILPVFGIGTVLLPWSAVAFIMKDFSLGVGLLVLFVFITVLREIVEPKILGKNLGLHPLLTLILLYLGYSFFGFFGMIILPPLGALVGVVLGESRDSEVKGK